MKVISAIHGINTGLTDASWNRKLQAYVVNNSLPAAVETQHYKAGPFSWWNRHVKNPRLAKAFVKYLHLINPEHQISIVAHSNGTDIAVRAIKLFAKEGRRIDKLIVIGAAIHSDIEKSGLRELIGNDSLGGVVAYCSPDDRVVGWLEKIRGGYGALGAKGLRCGEGLTGLTLDFHEPFPGLHALATRWFPGFGHSGYFSDNNIADTFETILSDLNV